MENGENMTSPINVYGLANIGCTMENVTFQTMAQGADATETEACSAMSNRSTARDEELFRFIHPAVECELERGIHEQVKRLVMRQGIQEICAYLKQLADEKKILLPQNSEKAYNELVRIGMPDGEGFSLKTFQKYYTK